MEKY
jgi:serine/threonine protein kinase